MLSLVCLIIILGFGDRRLLDESGECGLETGTGSTRNTTADYRGKNSLSGDYASTANRKDYRDNDTENSDDYRNVLVLNSLVRDEMLNDKTYDKTKNGNRGTYKNREIYNALLLSRAYSIFPSIPQDTRQERMRCR